MASPRGAKGAADRTCRAFLTSPILRAATAAFSTEAGERGRTGALRGPTPNSVSHDLSQTGGLGDTTTPPGRGEEDTTGEGKGGEPIGGGVGRNSRSEEHTPGAGEKRQGGPGDELEEGRGEAAERGEIRK